MLWDCQFSPVRFYSVAMQSRTIWKAGVAMALVVAGLAAVVPARGAVVYDNTTTYLRKYHAITNEFGDEIALSGTARVVTQFRFEYYGGFKAKGTERAQIRFYANNAPGIYSKPGTPLWDSGAFAISTNFRSQSLMVPSVLVPDTFTWTVQFHGLSQTNGDQAGLSLYDPPTVGGQLASGKIGSYDDYWRKSRGIWSFYRWNGNPVANFGAQVVAEPMLNFSARTGVPTLTLRGPAGRHVLLEFKSSLAADQPWLTVTNFVLTGQPTRLTGLPEYGFPQGVFRATLDPRPSFSILSRLPALAFSGPDGRTATVEYLPLMSDQAEWITLTNFVLSSKTIWVTNLNELLKGQGFFRMKLAP